MKITKNTIKKLIKEELKSLLDEGAFADAGKEIGDWASGRNPGLVNPNPLVKSVDSARMAKMAKMADAKGADSESLQHINQKLDQILHLLNMPK